MIQLEKQLEIDKKNAEIDSKLNILKYKNNEIKKHYWLKFINILFAIFISFYGFYRWAKEDNKK